MKLDVNITDPITYDSGITVAVVTIGTASIGYLYRNDGEAHWYIYGYQSEPDARGRIGDLKIILGEHQNIEEMAKRLLAYYGFIPSSSDISVKSSGVIDDDAYYATEIMGINETT